MRCEFLMQFWNGILRSCRRCLTCCPFRRIRFSTGGGYPVRMRWSNAGSRKRRRSSEPRLRMLVSRFRDRELLAVPGSPILVDAFRHGPVSLHLDSPASAVWAACIGGRLSVLCHSTTVPMSDIDRLLTLRFPSPLICSEDQVLLSRILLHDRPSIVVAPADTDDVRITAALSLAAPDSRLALVGCDLADARGRGRTLGLNIYSTSGDTHLLGRGVGP